MSDVEQMDAIEDWLTAATGRALHTWAAGALDAVLPSLTADGGEWVPAPDLAQLLATVTAWAATFHEQVLSPLLVLMAARAAGRTAAAGAVPPVAAVVPTIPLDPDGLLRAELQTLIAESAELRALVAELSGTTVRAAVPAMEAIVALPSWGAFTTDYLTTVTNRVVGMPDEIFRTLTADLAKGVDAGEGAADLAMRVREHLDVDTERGFEALATRATRIARTEATGAYNGSAMQAAVIEQDILGIELQKVWVGTLDTRTRDSHFAADGQRVALDGEFEIGGVLLRYPGDPLGPAREVINCRCSMLTVEADEALPGETDRQTERERSDGIKRDPFAEVRRRAVNEGVTRAREDPAGVGHVAAAANQEVPMPDETRRPWSGLLAPIGVPTGDGRIFAADIDLAFRSFPLPLMWQRSTDVGHDSSVIVGRIDTASIEDGQIVGTGVLFAGEDADEAAQLLADEVIRPSVDLCDVEWALADADGNPISDADAEAAFERGEQLMECTTAATVMGATLVAKPAFADAKIILDAETVAASGAGPDALVAAAAPWAGNAEFFADPQLDGPTPLTVTPDGRVYGHLATWGVCHVGIRDSCVTAPKTATDYAYFHVSEIPSTSGPVAVGRLTVGTGHAGARDGVHAAAAHYDNTGSTWAYARAGEDAHGIWVAGQVHPHATAEQVAEGSAAPLSGDWRRVGGNLELVAALGVVSGGFPVPRGARNTAGAETSLVAAGALRPTTRTAELSARAIGRAVLDEYLADQRAEQASALSVRARAHHVRALTARVNGAK